MHISLHANRFRRTKAVRRERGDTIVEVLIAILVVSMILGGAYVTANHSLLDTRDAQERSNAVKLVETQLEQLRTLATTNSSAIFGASVPASFCITSTGAVLASTNVACAVDSSGAPTSIQPIYQLAITQATTTSGGLSYTTFAVKASWYSVLGNGKDNLDMTYRLNQ